MEKIKVIIADRFPMFCRGLSEVLAEQPEIEVVDQTHNGLEVIDKVEKLIPEVVILDTELPDCDGIRAAHALHLLQPEVKVVLLCPPQKKEELFERAVQAGAKGFLLRTITPSELVSSVMQIARGGGAISPAVIPLMLERLSMAAGDRTADTVTLTAREKDVLLHMMAGKSNRQIAETLSLSENTVKVHIRGILDKFDVKNRVEAACYAISKGFGLNGAD
jgi:DNA-binding NarL/FixJ family response regulator